MPSNALFGKFGPIILLAVVQLVLIVAAPSTAPTANSALGTTPYAPTANGLVPGATTPAGTVPGAVGPGGTAPVGSGPGGSVATGPGGTTPTGTNSGGQVSSSATPISPRITGDTKHCVNGRQFSPAIDFYAPPCVRGIPGAAYPNNGGTTWNGVTSNRIEIVDYVSDYGAEVDAILKAEGLYYNATQAKQWDAAYANFINKHYQLYGRKVHIDTMEGNCQTVPPDYKCLIGDMDKIQSSYHPYAVLWSTTVCSQCFAELSRLHIVNIGGSGFSDAFHNDNAPYSYDAGMSATLIAQEFAQWWCQQMTSVGTSRTAIFAGTQNKAENFRNKKRVLGIVSTNDPDNEKTIQNVLFPALKSGCGENVTHYYFYAQNINTATTQSQQETQKMNTPTNPATSVACFCDPVAPQFGYSSSSQNNYWPESILATDQAIDFDSNAQAYEDSGGSSSLACPTPGRGCPFDNTVGIGGDDLEVAPAATAGVKAFKLGAPGKPLPVTPATLQIIWGNYSMLASLMENTGPVLSPDRMAAAAPSMGFRGGGRTGHPLKGFGNGVGNWCWTRDVAVLYWDKHRKSPYNGKAGHYVQIEGSRFALGQFPKVSQPPAPLPEKRR